MTETIAHHYVLVEGDERKTAALLDLLDRSGRGQKKVSVNTLDLELPKAVEQDGWPVGAVPTSLPADGRSEVFRKSRKPARPHCSSSPPSCPPQVRAKARKKAATTGGIVISTRARFGFTAASGTTDDARIRDITQALPPTFADQLFSAREQGANEDQLLAASVTTDFSGRSVLTPFRVLRAKI
ncbi:telomere-protecting terminal protein Tpg [Streptomyces sp. NPDC006530]|uniref:telomere-protecting terminal protein Tpg n=1 Tax=Streptomyces sp. NPDC006530 TaxID=3364750 RepID=UPI00367BD97B